MLLWQSCYTAGNKSSCYLKKSGNENGYGMGIDVDVSTVIKVSGGGFGKIYYTIRQSQWDFFV